MGIDPKSQSFHSFDKGDLLPQILPWGQDANSQRFERLKKGSKVDRQVEKIKGQS